jgi:hypothetical protein
VTTKYGHNKLLNEHFGPALTNQLCPPFPRRQRPWQYAVGPDACRSTRDRVGRTATVPIKCLVSAGALISAQ